MNQIRMTRRSFSLSLAGLAATTVLPSPSFAADVVTLELGDKAITTLSDGTITIPTGFFMNGEGGAASTESEVTTIGANLWLITKGARRILIDTGSGQALSAMFPDVGKLDALMAAEGLNKADITDIILTHMHADHIGGLLGPDAGGFKNAKIHVSEIEWNFWSNPELSNLVPEENVPIVKLVQSIAAPIADRVTTHAANADLGDGLTLVPLHGHTPGHCGVRISSPDAGDFFIVADAIISESLQFADPEVRYALDADPEAAAQTRVALLEELAETGTVFAATHLSFPGTGRVTRQEKGFAFEPLT